jgi:hypothetical protein
MPSAGVMVRILADKAADAVNLKISKVNTALAVALTAPALEALQ